MEGAFAEVEEEEAASENNSATCSLLVTEPLQRRIPTPAGSSTENGLILADARMEIMQISHYCFSKKKV